MNTGKTIRMSRSDWEKWDAALRSGKYKQGRGALHNPENDTYCCLGVLQHCLTGAIKNDDGELPSLEWLKKHNISFTYYGSVTARSPLLPKFKCAADSANDVRNRSFTEIADAIAEAVEFTEESK